MLLYHKHQFVACDRTLELYFVGCPYNCRGCQNAELINVTPTNHKIVSPEDIIKELTYYVSVAKQVHILGGEPLAQPHEDLIELCRLLKQAGFHDIILFTGAEKLPESMKPVEQYIDFIKFGKFKKDLLTDNNIDKETSIKLATSNQHIMRIKREKDTI